MRDWWICCSDDDLERKHWSDTQGWRLKPSYPSCQPIWSRSSGKAFNKCVLTLICDLRWVRGSLSTLVLKRHANQEQMRYLLVTQSPPCFPASVDKATSQAASANSQVFISVHVAPILQMGHGNLISFIQGWELSSEPGCGSSMHNATVPLRGNSEQAQHSPETACQHSCQTKQQKNRARSKLFGQQRWRSKPKHYKRIELKTVCAVTSPIAP